MDFKYINTEYLESVTGGDREVISELISLFREQVSEMADEMDSLFGKGDFYNLGLLAHKAKSSVAIMGMEELAVMLKQFELQAKDSAETDKYAEYINRFKEQTSAAVKELDEFMKNL